MTYDYFYGQQAEMFTFYRVPKVLFTEECFWNVSTDAKLLYGILLDRMNLSARNNWLDEEGRVYIIFTIEEIKGALGCAEKKAVKLLDELEKKCGLIERKRQGLGKPNLIYVKDFISGSVERQFLNCQKDNSGVVKNTIQELSKAQGNNTDTTIDDASHTSDTSVFPACDKAISELKNLVRIIVNEFGGTRIMITADHGFLYTYSPLTEDDKVDKTSFNGMDVEYGRRYAIMQKGAAPKYLMPVKFLDGKSEFDGFAPRESIRIKMNGGGLNFVHGGISLQEMVVPVIEYRYLRNDSMEYKRNKQKYDTKPVTVSLLSANRKISNMIFSLNFYQKDAVGDNREATTYLVYFTDESGKQISDVQKIIADKASDNGADRTFRCNFNLKSLKYSNTATYYLVIADEQGLQMPQREQFQIDIAFAVDEFDFFS